MLRALVAPNMLLWTNALRVRSSKSMSMPANSMVRSPVMVPRRTWAVTPSGRPPAVMRHEAWLCVQ